MSEWLGPARKSAACRFRPFAPDFHRTAKSHHDASRRDVGIMIEMSDKLPLIECPAAYAAACERAVKAGPAIRAIVTSLDEEPEWSEWLRVAAAVDEIADATAQ